MTGNKTADRNLNFLKLGGSLITDKSQPRTLRGQVLNRLAKEIATAQRKKPEQALLIGNGAGSFGHTTAKKYGTRQGVDTPKQWAGFVDVWHEAALLNKYVTDALHDVGLPAIAIHPSGVVLAEDGKIAQWDIAPIQAALNNKLIPVIHGDVTFDTVRGGTILSTEDLFSYLAFRLHPGRILLAGIEPGVWTDYPARTKMIDLITTENLPEILPSITESQSADVTGGMFSKVQQSMQLARRIPGLELLIFSGLVPGMLESALMGDKVGTSLHD